MDEITSSSTLRKRLFGIGDYIWMAKDEQLIKLLGYLGKVTAVSYTHLTLPTSDLV